jgi:hypothetical protein
MNSAPGGVWRSRFAFSRRAIPNLCLGLTLLGGSFALGAPRSDTPAPAAAIAEAHPGSQPGVSDLRAAFVLPRHLSETGLYLPGTLSVDPRNLAYVPTYPLWSDGAEKHRYVRLPEGTRIDASNVDDWRFPVGTRFWKEFTFGRRVETRYMERLATGAWAFATYIWNAEGTEAELAPARGARGVQAIAAGASHDVPSAGDCLACHEGRPGRVLGFNALQLSHEPDPLAPHREPTPPGAVDLAELERRQLIDGLPYALLGRAPRIANTSDTERAALGYLYGNCSGCHNSAGPLASLGLDFDQSVSPLEGENRALATSVGQASRYQAPGTARSPRVAAGRPEESTVFLRMRSRNAAAQMPPLGTKLADAQGLALIERWISEEL